MRIVSLCPSTTETLVALGLGRSLVGVTRYCVHPREALDGIPRVGGTKDPDHAAIAALEPDLVLCNAEENREADVAALAARHRVDVSHPTRVADVPPLLCRLGSLTGCEPVAEGWARRVEERIAAARPAARPVRFVYLIWKGPWMAAAAGTYISDLLETFGGVNVFPRERGPWPRTDEAELAALAPELVVLPDEPFRFAEKERTLFRELLPRARVELVSGDDLCWHGVRTLRGLEAAGALLRGSVP
ncbi:MAG TPA: helical backbone metal receptor [Thermoanaerobaculia bacterium]|nr:helical backbone metal receptor [Thermoanaerobaculia bacterium]